MSNKITRRSIIKQSGLSLTVLALPFPLKAFTEFNRMTNNKIFDVIIIGGSYAGLSAAMALGRSLRTVLIIDSGLPCNRQTPYSHNFITQDGEKPAVITEKAKTQVLKYGTVKFLDGLAVSGTKTDTGFTITTQVNEIFHGKKLIFATGIKDIMPDIKGFAACWGISVIHCPYCHGYEFRNTPTAVMANGERALHIVSLVNNLSTDITLLTSGKTSFNAGQTRKLQQHNIQIVDTEIAEIEHKNGHIKNVFFNDGSKRAFKAMYAAIPFTQHSAIPVSLGCELTEQGHIKTDMFQKTNIKGVFACGDNTSMMRSVAYAVAAGNIAGAMVNHEMTEETF